jgi:hypothetical protein
VLNLDDPISLALLTAERLAQARIDYALCGGLALAAYGRPRETKDADVAVLEADGAQIAASLEQAGVQVSVIEPGAYKSRIRRNAITRMTADLEAAGGTVTDEMREQAKQMAEREVALDEPDDVSAALVHALSADVALRRYLVTPDKEAADRTVRALVRELVELNEWKQNGFSRDELVKMLDEAMAK